MTIELKPCPFCGNEDVYQSAGFVGCRNVNCGAEIDMNPWGGPMKNGTKAAIKAWNTRAPIKVEFKQKGNHE